MIGWLKKYFVTRTEFLKYMLANNDLMELQNKQIRKILEEKNDYKSFSEELEKLTKKK